MRPWLLLAVLLFAAWPLAAEDVLPNGTRTVTNNDCTTSTAHGTMDDDPQSPGGDWCNATTNADTLITIQFATPSTDISTGTDAQTFELYVRKDTVSAPGSGTPTAKMDAYDDTSLIEAGAAQNVTSDSGELLTETWTSNTVDGSGIEVEIDCQEAGGGPNQRSCDFDAVRWDAALSTGERMMIIGQVKSITRTAR
jgi:hypothetical protein